MFDVDGMILGMLHASSPARPDPTQHYQRTLVV